LIITQALDDLFKAFALLPEDRYSGEVESRKSANIKALSLPSSGNFQRTRGRKMAKIFLVNHEYQTEVRAFEVAHDYQADILVFVVKQEYQAKDDARWFFVTHDY